MTVQCTVLCVLCLLPVCLSHIYNETVVNALKDRQAKQFVRTYSTYNQSWSHTDVLGLYDTLCKHMLHLPEAANIKELCGYHWDGWSCLLPQPLNSVTVQPCPAWAFQHIPPPDVSASSMCTKNGTWNVDVNNYARCHLHSTKPKSGAKENNGVPHNVKDNEGVATVARHLALLGYSLSLAALSISILVCTCIRKLHCARNFIHLNLFIAFFLRCIMSLTVHTGAHNTLKTEPLPQLQQVLLLTVVPLPQDSIVNTLYCWTHITGAYNEQAFQLIRCSNQLFDISTTNITDWSERTLNVQTNVMSGINMSIVHNWHKQLTVALNTNQWLDGDELINQSLNHSNQSHTSRLIVKLDKHISLLGSLYEPNWPCRAVGFMWTWFYLTTFFWYFVEGLFLHNMIHCNPLNRSRTLLYALYGWATPFVLMLIWVLMRTVTEASSDECWLSYEGSMLSYYFIEISITLLVVANILLFVLIVRELHKKLKTDNHMTERDRIKKLAKALLFLILVLGLVHFVSWPFIQLNRLFPWMISNQFVYYVHATDMVVGSFMGFFVSVLYCFANSEVHHEIKKRLKTVSMIRNTTKSVTRQPANGQESGIALDSMRMSPNQAMFNKKSCSECQLRIALIRQHSSPSSSTDLRKTLECDCKQPRPMFRSMRTVRKCSEEPGTQESTMPNSNQNTLTRNTAHAIMVAREGGRLLSDCREEDTNADTDDFGKGLNLRDLDHAESEYDLQSDEEDDELDDQFFSVESDKRN